MALSIDQLPEKTTLDDTDILHLRQIDRIDKKITVENAKVELGFSLPIGTILMFDANNAGGGGSPPGVSGPWVDNITMVGFYACIIGNAAQGCPNLVDTFIMGKVVAGAAGTGGSNTLIDHVHFATNQSANHTHTTNIGSHGHIIPVFNIQSNRGLHDATSFAWASSDGATLGHSSAGNRFPSLVQSSTIGNKGSGNQSASHAHTIGTGSVPGSTNNRPAYYSVIFVRKCA